MGDLPDWECSAARPVWEWVQSQESTRSLLLTGARQTGKTTLYRQAIRRLVREGYPSQNILYATFDHPLLKLAGLQDTLQVEVKYQGTEITAKKLKGLRIFLEQRSLDQGYVITQRWEDFGAMEVTSGFAGKEREKLPARVLKIPAPLACYWLST